jgi:hypothetical protein
LDHASDLRVSGYRTKITGGQVDLALTNAQVEHNLQQALALLDNAHGQNVSASGVVRRQMNQAIFARLWLVEDEILGADFTPAYRR